MISHAARFALSLGATSSLFALAPIHAHALSGHLAYLKGGGVQVTNLADGRVQSVSHTGQVTTLSLAPQGGRLLLFKSQYDKSITGPRALMALPPYKTLVALPSPLNSLSVNQVAWTRDGSQTLLVGSGKNNQPQAYLVTFRGGTAVTVKTLPSSDEGTLSGDGHFYAYTPNGDVRVRDLRTGREVTLLAWKKPGSLLAALKKSANPKKMTDLVGAYDPELARENRNWVNGGLSFARDGKTLFFASNAGTSMGASGNTTFAYLAGDTRTGKLLPLSKVGAEFGRIPHIAQVSPDGLRLMYGTSAHSSAIDNPVFIDSVYLPTQTALPILTVPTKGPIDSNLEDGAAWSPDSRSIAVSAYFYNTEALGRLYEKNPNLDDALPAKFTLTIRDARTGKVLKSIPGATRPSWGQ